MSRAQAKRALERGTRGTYFHVRPPSVSCLAFATPLTLCWCRAVTDKHVQLEIFPEARHVEALDPRRAIGPDTRVSALYRVRYGEGHQVHQVYHDRHGWYCAEHGPKCSAVFNAAGSVKKR